ncbi:MAG TPA: DUF2344 domain-containing protein [Actinobacteria bacterium]|nr:DUF2344 domain-containing protein [Actinomycetota bacterium]
MKNENMKITNKQVLHRLRIKYGKKDRLKFISHLDLISTLERALRRARLPFVLTQGFNPRAKLSYGPPLPIGIDSESEYVDIFLSKKLDLKEVTSRINLTLPDGLHVFRAGYIQLNEPSITKFIDRAKYRIEIKILATDLDDVQCLINKLLSKKELRFLKRGKEKKIFTQEAVFSIQIVERKLDRIVLEVLLSIGDQGEIRPDILIELLFDGFKSGMDYEILGIYRIGMYAKIGNELHCPLDTR